MILTWSIGTYPKMNGRPFSAGCAHEVVQSGHDFVNGHAGRAFHGPSSMILFAKILNFGFFSPHYQVPIETSILIDLASVRICFFFHESISDTDTTTPIWIHAQPLCPS